ncbi:MAG: hypothetical protein U1E05_19740, partial [Patescibacteria group bacterium]|nr:hypothetical protein [Patescibacteria group bacterium]
MRNCLPPIVAVVIVLLPVAAHCEPAVAAPSEALDLSAWRTLPVFDRGRRMPLESFANVVVREICGRENPTLDPCDIMQRSAEGSVARKACAAVFPDGKPRRFTASELLFSWLMEPELWEHLPFLEARHEELRRDLLDVPLRSRDGSRLKHVSPARLIEAEAFRRRLGELGDEQSRAQREGNEHSLTGVDRHVSQLYQAYALYRLLTYNPGAELDLDANRGFSERLM